MRRIPASMAGCAALALVLAGCGDSDSDTSADTGSDTGSDTDSGSESEPVELSFFMGNVEANVTAVEGLIAAFEAEYPHITIDLDSSGPGGAEGDNLVKTKLATGEMADLFWYNTGSLLQALSPDETLLNVQDQPWVADLHETILQTVSTDNGVYGAPGGTAMGGGILYHVPTYEEVGLEVPTTWDEFMANNEALEAAGHDAVIQSYGDTWTSQLFVLADFFNVYASDNEWAEKYTNNEVKYATDPVAAQGFQHLQDVYEGGYLNEDFASTSFDDALRMIATGEGAQYPMLTFAVSTIVDLYPEGNEDVGFFAMPGGGDNGLTVWMPQAIYAPADTEHPEEAKLFMEFVASAEGCDALTEAVGVSGPYLVDGCTIPDDVPRAVSDMLPYFEEDGNASPALEFLSPIKGPALEQITVEVGSGIRGAEDGAALYDEDVKKQAQQLGLEGW
jgi:raffinose/stachyose/melibiose transport system substrate-binding protein